jgi:hypothetical protein
MHKKHVLKHDATTKHQNYVIKSKQNSYISISNPFSPSHQHKSTFHHNSGFDLDETYHLGLTDSHLISEDLRDVPMDDLEPLSFGDLLGFTFGDRTYTIGEDTHDYFQEAVDSLQNGEHQFSFSRPLNLRGEELGLEIEEGGEEQEVGVDAFGIDIPGKV